MDLQLPVIVFVVKEVEFTDKLKLGIMAVTDKGGKKQEQFQKTFRL